MRRDAWKTLKMARKSSSLHCSDKKSKQNTTFKNVVIQKKQSVSDTITQKSSTWDLLKKDMFNLHSLQKTSTSLHTKMCIASAIVNRKFNTSSSHQTAYSSHQMDYSSHQTAYSSHQTAYSNEQTTYMGTCPLMDTVQPSSSNNGLMDNLAESMPARNADPANNLAADVRSFPAKLHIKLRHCPKKQRKWNSVLVGLKERHIKIYFWYYDIILYFIYITLFLHFKINLTK